MLKIYWGKRRVSEKEKTDGDQYLNNKQERMIEVIQALALYSGVDFVL